MKADPVHFYLSGCRSPLERAATTICIRGLAAWFFLLFIALAPRTGWAGDDVIAVAHRGGIVPGVPENTLAAFRNAIACGVSVIELDLRGTSDGGVVVMHDETVDRTTNGHGKVGEHTLAELKALDAGQGEHIPEYEEVLSCVAGKGVVLLLDIKQSRTLDVGKVLRMTRAHDATLQVIVGARSVDDVRLFKSLDPNLRVLGFIPDTEQADAFLQAGADIIRLWPEWIHADPGLTGRIHALGHPVWTTAGDSENEELEWLVSAGVDGILSDDPRRLKAFVRAGR